MLNKVAKNFLKLKLLLMILIFASTIPNTVLGVQQVYFASTKALNVAKGLVKAGRSPVEVVGRMIDGQHFPLITPENASEIFKIQWLTGIEDHTCLLNLSELIVADTGTPVGYQLRNGRRVINTGEIVAEYLGETLTESNPNQDFRYLVNVSSQTGEYRKIDASQCGGVARFAQHLPNEGTFRQYRFNDPAAIAMANVELVRMEDGRNFLIATREITPFEQIGFDYGDSYFWDNNQEFFDLEGNLVPREAYTILRRILEVVDMDDKGVRTVTHLPMEKLQNFLALNTRTKTIVINGVDENSGKAMRIEIARKALKQALRSSRDRPCVYGRIAMDGRVTEELLELALKSAGITDIQKVFQ